MSAISSPPLAPATPIPHASTRRAYHTSTELVLIDSFASTDPAAPLSRPPRDPYNASSVPLYLTATFKLDPTGVADNEYDYTRSGNPTRSHLEHHLCKVMVGAARVLAVASGMSALDIVLRLVRTGEEVIAGDDIYGGTNRLLAHIADSVGVVVHHIDLGRRERLVPLLSAKTRLLLIESPTNPLLKVLSIRDIVATVREYAPNCLVCVDNTMMTPLLQHPLALGCDIELHSGTKYLCGHHDIMAGVIAVRDPGLGARLYRLINSTGAALAPFDAWLLLRGVKTLYVRLERQQTNTMIIAQRLYDLGFPVHYPGLVTHPSHTVHYSQATGPGAVLSFLPCHDPDLACVFLSRLRLFAISVSFGCVNSLASMPCRMSHASISAETRRERGLHEALVRLCIGIEDAEDQWVDLHEALLAAGLIERKAIKEAYELENLIVDGWKAVFPRDDVEDITAEA